MTYSQHFNTKTTPQSQPIPGREKDMVKNDAGGVNFKINDWQMLDRFLILGSEGSFYYTTAQKLTRENAQAVQRCIALDGVRVVKRIVEISKSGRAPKNDAAIFALAMAAKLGNPATKAAAFASVNDVCRIGTHLFHFTRDIEAFGGWGSGTKKAVTKWYLGRTVDQLAYQLIKYQSRDGWSHRDILRLAHPHANEPAQQACLRWAVSGMEGLLLKDRAVKRGDKTKAYQQDLMNFLPRAISGFEMAKLAKSDTEIASLIKEFDLPRECVPTEFLNSALVWGALLEKMPLTALVRNLNKMTSIGLLAAETHLQKVLAKLQDKEQIKKARLHPINILIALKTYAAGKGVRGSMTWSPKSQIVNALDEAFYLSFDYLAPTGKSFLLALDVSGSMSSPIGDVPSFSSREATSAIAMAVARTEKNYKVVGFTAGSNSYSGTAIKELDITPRRRLDDICRYTADIPFGSTDCSLPMLWARDAKESYDVFVIMTDNETWAGSVQPSQALADYRRKINPSAKMIVLSTIASRSSIADPNDSGQLDIAGFDASVPAIITDFVTDGSSSSGNSEDSAEAAD